MNRSLLEHVLLKHVLLTPIGVSLQPSPGPSWTLLAIFVMQTYFLIFLGLQRTLRALWKLRTCLALRVYRPAMRTLQAPSGQADRSQMRMCCRRARAVFVQNLKITDLICTCRSLTVMMMMYLFTTVPHPHGHWQLQELLGNHMILDTMF